MEEEANKSSNASTSDSKFTSKKTRNAAGGKSKAKSSKIQISGVKSESRATGSSEASASYDCSLEVSSKRDREVSYFSFIFFPVIMQVLHSHWEISTKYYS